MINEEELTQRLRDRGYRVTPQRLTILQILLDSGTHLSPSDVFEQASGQTPGLTEPTVYRTLNFLCDEGILMCTRTSSGSLEYEVASNLHHHLVCRSCGASIEIEHGAFNDLYDTLKKQTGYALDERHMTLFGLCPACQGG